MKTDIRRYFVRRERTGKRAVYYGDCGYLGEFPKLLSQALRSEQDARSIIDRLARKNPNWQHRLSVYKVLV